MAAAPVQLGSLGAIVRWMDESVTYMLQGVVAPMVSNATAAIWPFITVAMSIALMWYGWLIASGAIQQPVLAALRKVVAIGMITGIAGAGGFYQTQLVGVILDLPSAVTSAITGRPDTPSQLLDQSANNGAEIGTRVMERSPSFWEDAASAFAFVVVAAIITVISAVLSAMGMAVLVAMKVGMGLMVIVGPLCILALLFDFTKEFFKRWVMQVFYFALYGALFSVIFTIVMGMFGMLQDGLLATTKAGEINVFSMITAIVVFMVGVVFVLSQVSKITGGITGGHGDGINVPFFGRVG